MYCNLFLLYYLIINGKAQLAFACSKLTIKTLKQGVFIASFDHILHLVLVWEFLIFYQIFFHVKQSVIISNKRGIYELSEELPDYLRLRILGN